MYLLVKEQVYSSVWKTLYMSHPLSQLYASNPSVVIVYSETCLKRSPSGQKYLAFIERWLPNSGDH